MTDTAPAHTLLKTWKAAQAELKAGKIDSPSIDARLLLEVAADCSRTDILTDPYRPVTAEQKATMDGYVARRLKREPVSRILGKKGFWKIILNVTPDVLSPRPDTEAILDVVMLAFQPQDSFTMIDLGTGSGAILLATLAERPAAKGVGTDISTEALAVARENAANLDLDSRCDFIRTEWAAGFADHSFDLVVSNPPYIPSDDIAGLDPEVREHDPHLALDGGPDGLVAYRELAPEIMRILKPGGTFAVEIGWDQGAQVKALFEQAGFENVIVVKDLSNRDRVVTNGPDPRTNPIPPMYPEAG
ncbi:peptide chain release factor N(5)-glutamine methyltransferase [Brevundimonas sp. M20]|uniref:peptide chain release factor N(5)-glutamine methyltransferase n=1 Tax=Brevundimonas sp. M20 TaxID=2591463 RepID=UPI0011468D93|nr:peptide chain release factor N(5)-glutamine methyltransferase [Brevundimonas sp. M20]QDH74675.1 peptide chain release factor N(5)-glutamine methyltransferase [Brevundimonas sp. M20]